MTKNTQRRVRMSMAAAACAAIAMLAATPASAASGVIGCLGNSENIVNGNTSSGSVSITTNYSLKCGKVGNRAQTNIHGQILWSSMPTLVSGNDYYLRNYAGSMYMSRHYHNGTHNNMYY